MIRPAKREDSQKLIELTAATGKFKPLEIETLEEVLADYHAFTHQHGHRCDVWEDGDALLGYVYFAPAAMTEGTWYIYWIAVDPNYHNQKLGRRLMRYAEEVIRLEEGRLLLVETSSTPHYEPTRQFYLRIGYEIVATLPEYYAEGDSMVIFAKRLDVGK